MRCITFGFTLQSEQQGEEINLPDVWDFEDQDSQAYGQVRLLDARQVLCNNKVQAFCSGGSLAGHSQCLGSHSLCVQLA